MSTDKEYAKTYYAQNKQMWTDKYIKRKECDVCKCSTFMMAKHLKTQKHLRNVELVQKRGDEVKTKNRLDELVKEFNELKQLLKKSEN